MTIGFLQQGFPQQEFSKSGFEPTVSDVEKTRECFTRLGAIVNDVSIPEHTTGESLNMLSD